MGNVAEMREWVAYVMARRGKAQVRLSVRNGWLLACNFRRRPRSPQQH